MKKLLLLAIVVLAAFAGCRVQEQVQPAVPSAPAPKSDLPRHEEPEFLDICESVFRHQFEHNASGAQQDAAAYFLTIFDRDPSEEFLSRFAGHSPPVRKGSEFAVGKGLKFRVDSIERMGPDKAQVSGGYYEASESSSGNVYTVVRRKGKWVVEKDEMQWIS